MGINAIAITETSGSTTEKVATPTFTPAAGVYTSVQSVEISSATDGATVYYTTDGTEPTTSSTVYSEPISVSETTTIKAIAVKGGMDNSLVASATYAILGHAGTEADPYTVADARAAIDANTGITGVYVTGIVSEIVTAFNSQYGNISFNISADGETSSVQLESYRCFKGPDKEKFTSGDCVLKGDEVVLYGNLTKFNSTYELAEGNYVVSLIRTDTKPAINASDVNIGSNAASVSIDYTITNPVDGVNPEATLQDGIDWISNVTVDVTNKKITFDVTENEGTEDRSATITLSYDGAEDKTVTVTQKHFVADYATLPFEFNGGRADIESTAGLTQKGLGTDYDNAPKLKFDTTGDELVLKFNERPGVLTFDIKGNSFSGSTFTVQTSENGIDYTNLQTYTELGSTQSESFNNLGENVRYIKWVYTNKSSGNVALGNIKLEAYVAPQNFTLTIPETDNVTITAAYGEEMLKEGENAEIEQNTEIILTVDAAEGYELKSLTVTGPDGQSFTPQAVPGTEGAYKFTMPSYNATISVNVEEYVAPTTATYVLATEVVSGKQYVIASGTSGDVKVMGDQNSNNRAAVDATIGDDGKLSTSEGCEFVIESATFDDAEEGKSYYSIFDEGENGGYLYAASSSSNHLKTQTNNNDNDNGVWEINIGSDGVASVVAKGTNTRNVMQYNKGSNLFSCYGSASQAPVYLFEKVEDTPQPKTIEVKIGETATGADGAYYSSVYYSDKALKVPAGVECLTYKVIEGALKESKKYSAGDVIPAGEAVVIKASASGKVTFSVTTETAEKDSNSQLKGVDKATSISGGTDYKFYKLTLNSAGAAGTAGFYWDKNSNNGSQINAAAHKCYLQVDADQVRGAKSFVFGDETDGIGQIEMGQSSNAEIYNLSGQRVNKAQKGIYIVNGKKVVIR